MKTGYTFPDGVLYSNATPMVGKKYGHLTVIAEAGRKDYGRPAYTKGHRLRIRYVRVVCDCGAEFEADARHVRRKMNRCIDCGREHVADYLRRYRSVKLPNGRTIAQVAEASGISLNTVYRRFLRGWPVEKLGAPLRVNGAKRGFGGSADLPERRRTMVPGDAR